MNKKLYACCIMAALVVASLYCTAQRTKLQSVKTQAERQRIHYVSHKNAHVVIHEAVYKIVPKDKLKKNTADLQTKKYSNEDLEARAQENDNPKKLTEKANVKAIIQISRGSRGCYNEKDEKAKKLLIVEATAYTNSYEDTGKTPEDSGYGITATGTVAKVGTVAVDPKVIPLKSKLYIKSMDGSVSYGYATAEDTGSAIKGNKIDLFYNTKWEANQFGRRKVQVEIIN